MSNPPEPVDIDEWKFLSQLHPGNNMEIYDMEILGHYDLDF